MRHQIEWMVNGMLSGLSASILFFVFIFLMSCDVRLSVVNDDGNFFHVRMEGNFLVWDVICCLSVCHALAMSRRVFSFLRGASTREWMSRVIQFRKWKRKTHSFIIIFSHHFLSPTINNGHDDEVESPLWILRSQLFHWIWTTSIWNQLQHY